MLTVGEIFLGRALDIDYQGQGIVKHQGYVVFVRGMLTHEEAKIRITQLKKNYGHGKIVELIKTSPDRINHSSHVYGSCNLIHLSPYQQLLWQHKTTRETLKKIMNLDFEVHETITDKKDKFYRNKSVFHVMDVPYLTLGLYHYDNSKLIQVEQFVLSDEKTNEALQYLFVNRVIVNPRVLKYIVFRTNEKKEILITLVANKENFLGKEELLDVLKSIEHVVGITLNINQNPNRILGDQSIVLYGENLIVERLKDIDVMCSDQSFFQINLPVIEKAYQLIENEIGKDKIVIDAYSGVGSIGFYLANKVKKMILIESSEDSINMANMTKDKYSFNHFEIIDERAEKVIHLVDADYLIVDPPRNGLTPEFLSGALTQEYEKIFYLSCDVKTLARDLVQLSEKYEVKDIYPLRMFFHTTSLETLVILYHK